MLNIEDVEKSDLCEEDKEAWCLIAKALENNAPFVYGKTDLVDGKLVVRLKNE